MLYDHYSPKLCNARISGKFSSSIPGSDTSRLSAPSPQKPVTSARLDTLILRRLVCLLVWFTMQLTVLVAVIRIEGLGHIRVGLRRIPLRSVMVDGGGDASQVRWASLWDL